MPVTEGASTLTPVYENAVAAQQAEQTAAAAATTAADVVVVDAAE